jgi:hypothetical protein
VVGPRGGATKTVSFSSLVQDVDASYLVRSETQGDKTEQIKGVSIGALLSAVDADDVYGGIEIARPDGSVVQLSKKQILVGNPPPVIYADGDQLNFLRPSTGASDFNAKDLVGVAGTLTLRQVDLGALGIEARASKLKVKAGELVNFSASGSGGGAGDAYEFTWDFDDGKKLEGARVSHRFKKRGTYRVLASVDTPGAQSKGFKVLEIQVGERAESKKRRSGGGTNDSANAPASGAADGDSGNGDQAATEQATPKKKPKRKSESNDSSLERVSGQVLLSASSAPLAESSTLAARSGSEVAKQSTGFELSTGVWAALAAIALLAFGAALENGKFRLRPPAP